ncbi:MULTISPECIES: TRAP transporter large permease [unclassified Variovorax]|jgi:tripartite ATP-independent transporter DctM subunit|uniref:TRAP transporter large permease n=1 Tax=unclassified Variovorax TaxID=663243 RepID=UPI002B238479|nr:MULTISPECIES: TRAP transporter large permease [unclassified Variovorax]MEB0058894.1 TRAP transporter large permease [Variovorax sp. LG9.2]MEB0114089.1 TRAP transporter large permease [Variovorax sp. RTB1]
MALTLLSLSFIVFLLLGMPVAFAIGLSCLLTFAFEGLPFETAIQMMVSGMNVFSFLAIPFFIFSGELMLHGGIADKIVAFARSLVGHWKGGLGLANVVASTLFGGVSGSPVADTSAMGGVMIPIMKREGYSAAYAVNVTTHASLSGALMPTSHNMIIYAFAAQAAVGTIGGHTIKGVSIGDLMFAGLIPVFWIMVCMLVAAYWQAAKYGFPRRPDGSTMIERFPGWNAVLRTFIASIPGLMVIVIILVCVMEGIATATEAAAIAVTYSLLLTVVIYRTMTKQKLFKSLAKASKTTGVILLLIGVSNMLRYQMAYLEIPDTIEAALLAATTTPWLMLLYINIIQIFLGIFLDMAAHILITTPLFLPLAIQMGVGPVQFGMMLLLNCALGLVHPPVGTVQFIGCAIGKISIGEATKTAWPYYLAIFIAITLVTYVPAFSTWLPSLITGHVVL